MYKDYTALLAMVLRENQPTVFELDGSESHLLLQRHLDDYVRRVSWASGESARQLELQLCIDVWASWEVLLAKSSYSLPYYAGILVDDAWWRSGIGSPPCILLSNSQFEFVVAPLEHSPMAFTWHGHGVPWEPDVYAHFADEGRLVRDGWWISRGKHGDYQRDER